MLLRFSVENWMSFRDKAVFSMIATRERQHGERVPRVDLLKARLLPVAAVYGGNASGKTNLFKALSFVKKLVVEGTQPDALIPVEPFRLDGSSAERPSRFSVEILTGEAAWEFAFTVTRQEVLEEKLVRIGPTSEKVMYRRRGGEIDFAPSLREDAFLGYAFRGTRDNQLFLTNSVSQKAEAFRPVYDWFRDTLELVAPDSRFEPFEDFINEDHPLYAVMNSTLSTLDTGIARLGGEDVPLEGIGLPEAVKADLGNHMKEGATCRLLNLQNSDRYAVTRRGGRLAARKLVAYHPSLGGPDVRFEMRDESDGSRRIIDLLPAFLELADRGSNKVYVIDELDRSLHTQLTRKLLEAYLGSCSNESRAQLLFTTHDVLLMDQDLFRRDEMWVTEREADGASRLFSFSEYKDVRYDKDIRKSYLQGRLGGVPRLLVGSVLGRPDAAEPSGEDD